MFAQNLAKVSVKSFVESHANYTHENAFVAYMRRKRYAYVTEAVETIYKTKGGGVGIDVGGRSKFWPTEVQDFFRAHNFRMIILNVPSDMSQEEDTDVFTFRSGDGCDLSSFGNLDLYFSNSTIEHVPEGTALGLGMASFAKEALRVAPWVIVQTPDYMCPIEPHFMLPFLHWVPWPLRAHALLLMTGMTKSIRAKVNTIGQARERILGAPVLLDKGTFKYLFPGCEIRRERLFGIPFVPKSLIAIRKGVSGDPA